MYVHKSHLPSCNISLDIVLIQCSQPRNVFIVPRVGSGSGGVRGCRSGSCGVIETRVSASH